MSRPAVHQIKDHINNAASKPVISQPVVCQVGDHVTGVPKPSCHTHSQLFTRSRATVVVVYPNYHVTTSCLPGQGPPDFYPNHHVTASCLPGQGATWLWCTQTIMSQPVVYQVKDHSDSGVSKPSCHCHFNSSGTKCRWCTHTILSKPELCLPGQRPQ